MADRDIASGTAFFVNNRPRVAWAWDLEDRNLQFLRSIDPAYFAHVAQSQAPLLDAADATAQYAAAAIRIAHAQAVETLFALLGALAQAPQGPIGWMLAYNSSDLRAVTTSLTSPHGLTDHSMWKGAVRLSDLSTIVVDRAAWDGEKKQRVSTSFLRLWRLWSDSILDDDQVAEYNSFKHGSRAALGGHTVAIGTAATPGGVAQQENMVSLGGSAFGSNFFKPIDLDGKLHQYPRRQSNNWSAAALVAGLELLAMSIQNVTSCLRILGGDDATTCQFQIPRDPAAFDLPFTPVGGITFSNFDFKLGQENIERLSKQQVLDLLRGESGSLGG